jgi:hypothetical protein
MTSKRRTANGVQLDSLAPAEDSAGDVSLTIDIVLVAPLLGLAQDAFVAAIKKGRREDPSVRAAIACTARSGLPRDVWIQLRLTDLIRCVSGIDADHARLTVDNGVVRLSGQVDGMYGVQALRRIAAAVPEATAIIDDL